MVLSKAGGPRATLTRSDLKKVYRKVLSFYYLYLINLYACYFAIGWAPSTFVSTRNKRSDRKDYKPEDFMDEEDLEVNIKTLYRLSVVLMAVLTFNV